MQLILSCRIYSSRWAFWEDNRSHSNLREELWQSTGNKGLSSVSEVTASRTMPSENIPHLEENPYQCLSNRDTISGATWQSIPLCNMECKMEFCSLSTTTKARHLISIVLWPMTCRCSPFLLMSFSSWLEELTSLGLLVTIFTMFNSENRQAELA